MFIYLLIFAELLFTIFVAELLLRHRASGTFTAIATFEIAYP